MHLPRPSPKAFAVAAILVAGVAIARDEGTRQPQVAPAPAAPAAATHAPPLPDLRAMRLDPSLGRFVAPVAGGRAVLTVDARLQERLERFLSEYQTPYGAVVLLEPRTGRVVALAEHAQADGGRRGFALRAAAPAASVFKIVTSAALLEQGVLPDESVCYHGGRHRLQPRLLDDDPRRDRSCVTLASAFGKSTNVVFAKLADRGLSPELLRTEAQRFLFNAPIPLGEGLEVSRADIPQDAFGLAQTAAGFGEVRLSPLHGALLASIVANRGLLVPPRIVDVADGAEGPGEAEPIRVVDESIAGALAEMMRRTVTDGTARRVFRRAGGPLRGVSVAGKTGSLADRNPYRDWSWFVGYAPVENPQIAVAAVVGNGTVWRVRAPLVAREALSDWFAARIADAGGGSAVRTAALVRAPAAR